jgi:hypothetical protein
VLVRATIHKADDEAADPTTDQPTGDATHDPDDHHPDDRASGGLTALRQFTTELDSRVAASKWSMSTDRCPFSRGSRQRQRRRTSAATVSTRKATFAALLMQVGRLAGRTLHQANRPTVVFGNPR